MELLDVYWREVLVGALSLTVAALFLKTDTLRPAILIFGAAAVSLAATIDAPTPGAVKVVITGIRDTMLQPAAALF